MRRIVLYVLCTYLRGYHSVLATIDWVQNRLFVSNAAVSVAASVLLNDKFDRSRNFENMVGF